MKLPREYCPFCAGERPDDFAFIREAEIARRYRLHWALPKHALGCANARIEDNKLVVEIGARTFVGAHLLPENGMLWEGAAA